ncbi:MAG: hypothetical protein IJJ11_07845 [Methanosphaera sp.]|nr:hypothetical protein [Methanobrevibacter sp.]MBQ6444567.1 hypothetical protein [Methanosphaera sp.]
MIESKCKYCKHLLINLVGPSQTCLKLNITVDRETDACMDYEFSQKAYDREQRYEKELKGDVE